MNTASVRKIITYAIYMAENTYGSIDENVEELIDDLVYNDFEEVAAMVNRIVDNLPTERSHEFIRRQWVAELRKLEKEFSPQ